MILGNKCDEETRQQVRREEGEMVSYRTAIVCLAVYICICPCVCPFIHHFSLQLAAEVGMKFMETSAKTGQGVEVAFLTLARDIKDKMDQKMVHQTSNSLTNLY